MKKTVLITGAGRGIGRGIAKKFASHGYNIIINYFQSEAAAHSLEEEINAAGGNSIAICADVSDRAQVEQMIRRSIERFGKIDLLINNAGIAEMKLFTDIDPSYWDRIFEVNVKGIFNCCHFVVPQMLSEKKGKIINISSVWGLVGASMESHYSATKGAVNAFTKALAKELGPSGITVNAIAPGAVYTDMIAGLGNEILDYVRNDTPLGDLGTVEQVADMVYFLADTTGDFITGQIISPNGGYVIY
ncbi:MAG: 3-oxoacyl-ACP reductase FabG [Peptostreptococcaceae bacterium]|nr:3-oxoacyl-ACP reductase FabG [Peptostreptococcaceae bacterium]